MRMKKWLVVGVAAVCALALASVGAPCWRSPPTARRRLVPRPRRPEARHRAAERWSRRSATPATKTSTPPSKAAISPRNRPTASRSGSRSSRDGDFGAVRLRGSMASDFDGKPFEHCRGRWPRLPLRLRLRPGGEPPTSWPTSWASPPEQLREELSAEGATLATVAEAHGKSRDELKDVHRRQYRRARSTQAVADGNLTQEQADDINAEAERRASTT